MTAIRHIVFDIGRVLIHYDPELPFLRLIPDAAERRWTDWLSHGHSRESDDVDVHSEIIEELRL